MSAMAGVSRLSKRALTSFILLSLLPVVIFGLGNWFIGRTTVESVAFSLSVESISTQLQSNPEIHAALGLNQAIYTTVVVVLIAACIGLILVVAIASFARRWNQLSLWIAVMAAILSAVLVVSTYSRAGKLAETGTTQSAPRIFDKLTESANLEFGRLPISAPGTGKDRIGDTVPYINALAISLTAIAAVFLGIWAAALFAALMNTETGTADLSEAFESVRHLLFAGSAILGLGIAFELALELWPAALFKPSHKSVYVDLVIATVSTKGALYSIVLLAIYLPVFLAAKYNLAALIRRQSFASGEELAKWIEHHGFSASFAKSMKQIAALLTPLLVGPVGGTLLTVLQSSA